VLPVFVLAARLPDACWAARRSGGPPRTPAGCGERRRPALRGGRCRVRRAARQLPTGLLAHGPRAVVRPPLRSEARRDPRGGERLRGARPGPADGRSRGAGELSPATPVSSRSCRTKLERDGITARREG